MDEKVLRIQRLKRVIRMQISESERKVENSEDAVIVEDAKAAKNVQTTENT